MLESELKVKVKRYLRNKFPYAFIWKISDSWYSGIPDIYVLNNGQSYFIELKVGKKEPTKLQRYTLAQLEEAGAIVGVAYSVQDVIDIMKKPI